MTTTAPDVRLRTTTNLSFAAYVHMNGLKLSAAHTHQAPRGREFRFTFEDPGEVWDQLNLSFANSEAQRHDQAVRALKQLCRGQQK
jgi:hypothetical protein